MDIRSFNRHGFIAESQTKLSELFILFQRRNDEVFCQGMTIAETWLQPNVVSPSFEPNTSCRKHFTRKLKLVNYPRVKSNFKWFKKEFLFSNIVYLYPEHNFNNYMLYLCEAGIMWGGFTLNGFRITKPLVPCICFCFVYENKNT